MDPKSKTKITCVASHGGLDATLEQKTGEEEWVPVSFASRYLNAQEKKISSNKLEVFAVIWAVDEKKYYLLGTTIIIATDHKALTSAIDTNSSNKVSQSR